MAASEHRIRKAEDISDATGRSVGIGLLDWHLEDQGINGLHGTVLVLR